MSRPTTKRDMVEQCEAISVSQINGLSTSGTWTRTTATLTNTCRTCGSNSQVQLDLVKTRQGPRYLCPACKAKVTKLYRPPGAPWNDWRCQRCHGLGYSSQYQKKTDANPFGLLGFEGGKV